MKLQFNLLQFFPKIRQSFAKNANNSSLRGQNLQFFAVDGRGRLVQCALPFYLALLLK
jgi:hypothetical protein